MKQEAKEFIEKYTAKDVVKNIDAAVELSIIYQAALSKKVNCMTCDSILLAAYAEIEAYTINNYIHTMSENFKLKSGYQILLHKKHEIITENNLTSDDLAIDLLKQNKQLIAAFETYPDNWEELVAGTAKEKKSEPATEEKAETKKPKHK